MRNELIQKTEKIKFLGIPVGWKVYLPESVKTYFWGIRIKKKKYTMYELNNTSKSSIGISKAIIPTDEKIFNLKNNELNIAFKLGGGLGDYLIAANFIVLFREYIGYDKIRIDVFGKEDWVSAIFKDSRSINNYYTGGLLLDGNKDYDFIISLTREPIILSAKKNKIYEYSSAAFELMQIYEKEGCRKKEAYSNRPSLDGQLLALSIIEKYKRCSQPDIMHKLGMNEQFSYTLPINLSEEQYLNEIGLGTKNFITIHRGVHEHDSKESVKQWPTAYYNILVEKIKKSFPEITIVQLGFSKERCPLFDNIDVDLIGKTSMEQVKVILKNSALHIDGEGGLVHLRHALQGGKSIVLFGATSPEFYGYSENINLRGTGCSHWCEWLTTTWQAKCSRGFYRPPCMYSLTPDIVFNEVKTLLENENE